MDSRWETRAARHGASWTDNRLILEAVKWRTICCVRRAGTAMGKMLRSGRRELKCTRILELRPASDGGAQMMASWRQLYLSTGWFNYGSTTGESRLSCSSASAIWRATRSTPEARNAYDYIFILAFGFSFTGNITSGLGRVQELRRWQGAELHMSRVSNNSIGYQ